MSKKCTHAVCVVTPPKYGSGVLSAGHTVLNNNNNNNIYLLQLGVTWWQWLFYMYTKYEIVYY